MNNLHMNRSCKLLKHATALKIRNNTEAKQYFPLFLQEPFSQSACMTVSILISRAVTLLLFKTIAAENENGEVYTILCGHLMMFTSYYIL